MNVLEKKSFNNIIVPALIFVLTAVLLLIFFTDAPLGYDENFTLFHGQKPIDRVTDVSRWDINPPFFYYVLHFWIEAFGYGEFAFRSFCLICTSITAVVTFLFVKRFFSLTSAYIVTAFYLSSNTFFFYAQEVRGYCLLFLLIILSTWLLFNIAKDKGIHNIIFLGIVNYMIILTHYNEGIIMLTQGCMVLFFHNWQKTVKYLVSVVLTFVMLEFLFKGCLLYTSDAADD